MECGRQVEVGLLSLMGMGSHGDAIMFVINPLVSVRLGGQILAV